MNKKSDIVKFFEAAGIDVTQGKAKLLVEAAASPPPFKVQTYVGGKWKDHSTHKTLKKATKVAYDLTDDEKIEGTQVLDGNGKSQYEAFAEE